ncbi:MAG: S-layer homology domain-containing protein [Clostridiales bacterium]|nr:S-layer homology domain-containing protein [Clostridiales bacterium]
MLVTLAMVLSMLPTVAFAADATTLTDGGSLTSGEYVLENDIILTTDITIPVGAEVTIDLNGNELKGTGTGRVITVYGILTLTDTSNNGNGTITGGEADGGGGVCVGNDATFTMNGGTITGNKTDTYGGGVDVNVGATFTMNGGTITNNTANYGGGVCVYGTFIMTGGEISGNTATSYGGGVFLVDGSTFKVSSTPVIKNNTCSEKTNNVYLANMKYITLEGVLEDGASIGVTTRYSPDEDGIQITTTEDTTEYYATAYQYFIPDAEGVISYYKDDGYVVFLDGTSYHTVTLTLTGATTEDATYYVFLKGGTEYYEATVTAADDYELPENITIYINGSEWGTCKIDGTNGTICYNSEGTTIVVYGATSYAKNYEIVLEAVSTTAATYSIGLSDDSENVNSISPEGSVEAGETITITPDDGYTITGVTIECEDTSVEVPTATKNSDGTWSFTMPASNVTVTVTTEETYNIIVTNSSYSRGDVDVDDEAAEGDTVTIEIDPDNGYKVSKVTVTGNVSGDTIYSKSGSSTTHTFTMPDESVIIKVTYEKKSSSSGGSSYSLEEGSSSSSSGSSSSDSDTTSDIFKDLSTSHVYYDAIMEAYENGWMVGISDDTFAADGYLTRAMAAQILWNLEGNPEPENVAPFVDVTSDAWYADAVAWASENGIVIGYDYIHYGPNDYVTMEQFCIMLAKYRGEVVPEYTGNSPYATRGWVAYMITN